MSSHHVKSPHITSTSLVTSWEALDLKSPSQIQTITVELLAGHVSLHSFGHKREQDPKIKDKFLVSHMIVIFAILIQIRISFVFYFSQILFLYDEENRACTQQ